MATHPAVRGATVSTVTGNVLVQFDPALPVDSILDHTRAVLRREIALDEAEGQAWHRMPRAEVCTALASAPEVGLPAREVERRLVRHGRNRLPEPLPRSEAAMFAEQFLSLPVALLAGVGLLSLAAGSVIETGAIAAVVVLNGVIGYATESRAERTIRELTETALPEVAAIRDGTERDLPVEGLVPGDILVLRRGDVVPADARVIEAEGLSVSEAGLTGESLPVRKQPARLDRSNLALGDRHNMVYRGSAVTGGSGTAIVVATGGRTEAGRVQRLMGSTEPPETPMERQLGGLGQTLVWGALGAAALVATLALIRGLGPWRALRSALSVAVAVVPEGLPMVATTTLAFGVRKVRGRGVLVRQLTAFDTLASVDTICFDKTGTLTMNDMSLARVVFDDRSYGGAADRVLDPTGAPLPAGADDRLERLLQVGCLCSEADLREVDGRPIPEGSATEEALVRAALAHGLDVATLRDRMPVLAMRLRTEGSQFMGTIHDGPTDQAIRGLLAAVKGNPLEVLARCTQELGPDGRVRPLTEARRSEVAKANLALAGDALRILGFAYRENLPDADEDTAFEDLTWLGLCGLEDPVREGAREAIAQLQAAGIRTIMLTGDQKATACAVLEKAGLNGTREARVVDAAEVEDLSPAALARALARADGLSRVSPAQKLGIVRALQAGGATVAMIGDGINDGPALRAADVGITVGGDDAAARRVSDIHLDTPDISAILEAVIQGRTTRVNSRKSIRFLLTTNMSEVLMMVAGTAAGQANPLTPMQLLWINLISDVLPGIGLAGEPPPADVMARGPLRRDARLVSREDLRPLVGEAGILGFGAFAAGQVAGWRFGRDSVPARTVTFGSLVVAQLLHALTCRSRHSVVTGKAPPSNPLLTTILVGSAVAQGGAMMIPAVRRVLGVGRIGGSGALLIALAGTLPLLVIEILKAQRRFPRAPRRGPGPLRLARA